MEIPSNQRVEEIMDFKKFAQSRKGLIFCDRKVWIEGVFRESDGKIIVGDNFLANVVHTSGEQETAEEIYKTYIEWFNYTLRHFEKERFFVSAKFGKEESKDD
jgi:hypothetical protein